MKMSSLPKYLCDLLIIEADYYNLPNLLVNDASAQDDTAEAMKSLQKSVKNIEKDLVDLIYTDRSSIRVRSNY